jgi:hypothetical protein
VNNPNPIKMSDHIKLFNTLSLSSSDTREETLKSIILNALYENEKSITRDQLIESIDILFDLEPYQPELIFVLENLIKQNIISEQSNKVFLTPEVRLKLKEQYQEYSGLENDRYNNFKEFLKKTYPELTDKQCRFVWDSYLEYLLNCFYHYGEDALLVLNPNLGKEQNEKEINHDFLRAIYTKLNDETLVNVLKYVIDNYADNLSADDLDYLDSLAQKTLAFTSLGYDPKSLTILEDINLIDWTVYLDTNVLFSLLGLHIHPENEACKNLIQLIKENHHHLKIAFRVSELTLKELVGKKSDFDDLDLNLTAPAIRALLKSRRIDEFSRQFYESLLNHREETLDPRDIIDLAPITLEKGYSVKISRNRKQLEALGDSFIETRIQDYLRYVQDKNEFRQSFAGSHNISLRELFKSDNQARHDIMLREFIIDSRHTKMKEKPRAFTDLKYFAISLDDVLIAYDKNEAKIKEPEFPYPVFFKPSFLLNKLIRLLPIKITSSYKKAFFKALSSRGFNKDIKRSRDIQKVVNYLKIHGIDNETVILNLISEDLFLEKFHEKQSNKEELDKFFEQELNKQLETFQVRLEETNNRISTLESSYKSKEGLVDNLKGELSEKESNAKLLNQAIEQLSKKIEILEKKDKSDSGQLKIGFDNSNLQDKVSDLEKKLQQEYKKKREDYLRVQIKKWRGKTWWILGTSIAVLFVALIIFTGLNGWNFSIAISKIISAPENQNYIIIFKILGAICLLVFEYFIIVNLYSKYCDIQNINAFKDNIKYPDELTKY